MASISGEAQHLPAAGFTPSTAAISVTPAPASPAAVVAARPPSTVLASVTPGLVGTLVAAAPGRRDVEVS